MMTNVEMRKAKAELHKVIFDTIFSYGGNTCEDAEMLRYVIEVATNGLVDCVKENT